MKNGITRGRKVWTLIKKCKRKWANKKKLKLRKWG